MAIPPEQLLESRQLYQECHLPEKFPYLLQKRDPKQHRWRLLMSKKRSMHHTHTVHLGPALLCVELQLQPP
jgi:hypothetical protein